ncbi:zinc finger protein CONSTANS-like [Mercurialis annua]|uniref:zinc finger protein CONSTANS-like n=1 Tax=Mercurialis annua TaxID=3986 RepID=UPI0024AF32AA|nr:zinc finger protein CONSTANS-like [Mercurialis annua]
MTRPLLGIIPHERLANCSAPCDLFLYAKKWPKTHKSTTQQHHHHHHMLNYKFTITLSKAKPKHKQKKMKNCELCNSPAKMHCESDQASLCWVCDAKVHAANFLVAKHSRTLLCHLCQSFTPWTASGPNLRPTVSVCDSCVNRSNRDDNDEEEEEEDEDSSEESDEDENGDGDNEENQVVPLSSSAVAPPSASSSSNSEDQERGSSSDQELHFLGIN